MDADEFGGCWAAAVSLSGRMSFPCCLAAGRDPAGSGLRLRARSREPPKESQRVSCFFFPFLSLSQPVGALSAHDVEPRIHAASAEGAIPLGSLTAEVFTLLRLS